MALLQALQLLFMMFDGCLQLFYIFRSPLTERRLGLPVPLLSLFGCRVYLQSASATIACDSPLASSLTGFLPPLRF